MPVKKVKEFLDKNKIRYVSIKHSPAYTSQEIAESAHISGKKLAKTVMIKIDGKMAMAVLPGKSMVDIDKLKESIGAEYIELASEKEFQDLFPGCEPGAMPPFGNLYEMNVYIDESLIKDDEIIFNAGSHTELMKMEYTDFEKLVNPAVMKFSLN